jgi:acetyl-CoA acetyltransferase
MGSCAELCAQQYGVSRQQMDDHAVQAFQRATAAAPYMRAELVPVPLPARKGGPAAVLDADESLAKIDEQKLRGLKPFFKQVRVTVVVAVSVCVGIRRLSRPRGGSRAHKSRVHQGCEHDTRRVRRGDDDVARCTLRAQEGGSVTAGNSSPITDGGCALVLVSAAKAAELGCPVLAVVRGYGDANQDPEWFTTGACCRAAHTHAHHAHHAHHALAPRAATTVCTCLAPPDATRPPAPSA